jgi:hypothetical protein
MALTLTRSCTASIDIAAPIDVVWDLVSDIARIGEWSIECRSCEWLAGATDPRPGARFRGRNRRNATLWTRTCEAPRSIRRSASSGGRCRPGFSRTPPSGRSNSPTAVTTPG